ncbi:MAG: hypothetical protein AAGC44_14885 [Planctomycetota bacterium]
MRHLPALSLLTALVVGCQNPYVGGYTGERAGPLEDEAAVLVIGANRADPVQMQSFNRELNLVQDRYRLLGTSTIVSASLLRDPVAAEAARTLGASRVFYSFAYLDSTVERRSDETYHRGSNNAFDRFERRTYETTRHWYEYRAYFFSDQPALPLEQAPENKPTD